MDLHLPRVEFTSKLPPLATTQQQTNSSASASIIFIADHCSARSMLRSFDVWKRIESMCLVRYRCFEDTSTGKFCVQSADFFDAPIRPEQLMHSEKQFLELMIEESPFTRSGPFDSVEEAIAKHDAEFRDE